MAMIAEAHAQQSLQPSKDVRRRPDDLGPSEVFESTACRPRDRRGQEVTVRGAIDAEAVVRSADLYLPNRLRPSREQHRVRAVDGDREAPASEGRGAACRANPGYRRSPYPRRDRHQL